MGCLFLLQGIFLTQGSNPHLFITLPPGKSLSLNSSSLIHFKYFVLPPYPHIHTHTKKHSLGLYLRGGVERKYFLNLGLTGTITRRRQWHPLHALAWKIRWTEEPGGLQSMGSLRVDTTEWLHFHFHALEKEMATHSSVLAWRIPRMGEPGGLPSKGPHRVGHGWSFLAAAALSLATYFCVFQVFLREGHA